MCSASAQQGPPGPAKPYLLLFAVVIGLSALWLGERERLRTTSPPAPPASVPGNPDSALATASGSAQRAAAPVVPVPAQLQRRIDTIELSLRGAELPGTLPRWAILFALGPKCPAPVLDWAWQLVGKPIGGVANAPTWAGPNPHMALLALALAAGKGPAEAPPPAATPAASPLALAWQLEAAALQQLRQGPNADVPPALPVLFESALRELQRPRTIPPAALHRLAQTVFRSSLLMPMPRHQQAVKVAFGRLRQHQGHMKTELSQLEWLETLASYLESRRSEALPKVRQQLQRQTNRVLGSTAQWQAPSSAEELYLRAIALRGLRLARANW